MKKIIAFIIAATVASVAYANCTTSSFITPEGKMIVCTSCCFGGQCTTSCTN